MIKGWKGFNKDLKCRGMQYEIGKTFEEPEAEACEKGLHFCEYPLDVLGYYPPAESRYAEVEADGEIDRDGQDSKVATTRLHIKAEIGLPGLIKAGVDYIKSKVDWADAQESNTGNQSAATNTGNRSAATNTGDWSAATNTGDWSAATNTGDRSAATNTGDWSAATNTGDWSAATNTGDRSAATNTGNRSAATNTGNRSAATNTGNQSAATNTGNQSAATNTGDWSAATNTGDWSAATNTGYQSAATNTGNRSAATNTGNRSAATVSGKDSVAIATGYDGKAKGSLGSAIVVVERGDWNGDTYPLLAIKSAIVDGESIKADTFYKLQNGEFVEVD
ncbi:hypothetical protein J1TS5_26170 [Paenibacillus macerans]|uniref:DUF7666 domain-containing protein n=1 Tax=Paenibacillus macerans TaxID=44252 RepID=UPI001AFF0520|nr:hypothetical protein [Paenibacillus macerans]GIP10447.1 hypothetical protein J1TS5_26170 [Paenibacillus macerans]